MESKDPHYDPQGVSGDGFWEGGGGGPRGDPYAQPHHEPRYSYQPPPPAYAAYPPPVYAHPYGYPMPYRRPTNPALPVAGGILCIVTGVLGLVFYGLMLGDDNAFLFPGLGWCAVIGFVLSVVAILGGVCSMMKRMFPMALMGAVCAMCSFAFAGIGFGLGLLALVLIAISKDAFTPGATTYQQY